MFGLLKTAGKSFAEDDGIRMAAALAYYTLFTMPPLLVVLAMVSGLFFDASSITGRAFDEIARVLGEGTTEQLRTMLRSAEQPGSEGALSWILGVGALLFGATGAFVQLQAALNRAWMVRPDPDRGFLRSFLLKRLISVGMVLAVAVLLLVSVILSAAVSAMGEQIAAMLPGALSGIFAQGVQLTLTAVVFVLLVAAVFVVLPDAEIAWRDVWIGAAFTGVLLVIGQFLLGLYVANRDPGGAFGSAGPIVLLLMLVYLSSVIVLFGAEFTQAWAARQGRRIRPEDGAVRVRRVVKEEMEPPEERHAEASAR